MVSALAALLLSAGVAGVAAAAVNVPAPGDAISNIRRRYAAINRGLSRYRVVKKGLSGFSTEGGELVAYFDGGSVAKLTATHYGEMGRTLEEFYYRDGELIFVFRKQYAYDAPLSGKVSGSEEDRFYFDEGALIRWVRGRAGKVAPAGGEYLKAQARYLDSSRLLLAAARSREPTFEAPQPPR